MKSAHRRGYLDAARGLAVLLMIEAHTTDAWTRPASKTTIAFRNATVLGGFAAPLFLWLAGVTLVLAAARAVEKTGDRAAAVEAIVRRGLQIFILGFLFRLQAFIVSPGNALVSLFRVDILNVMGPAIVFAGIVWGMVPGRWARVWAFGLLATATAMLTPLLRASTTVNLLPMWVQWYVRPAGEHTTFTMFPWAGFVFAGAGVGALLATARETNAEIRVQSWLACAGAAIVAGGVYASTLPTVYKPPSSFWTSSPAWFAIRTGILMLALAVTYATYRILSRGPTQSLARYQRLLERLGRSSLFVYWIHVELVYGYASWFWRGRLPLWGTTAAYAAFAAAMYGVVLLRDRLVESRATFAAPAYTAPTGSVRL